MSAIERVQEIVRPLIEQSDALLYDIEHESGILRIMIDRTGGIDVDTIGELSQRISDALDANDPFPGQRYLLEVTSPGIERKLRLPEHFQHQLGADINVKVRKAIDGERRFDVRLDAADETGINVTQESAEGPVVRRLRYEDIESARTIFHWEEQTMSPGRTKAKGQSATTGKKSTTNKKASTR